MQFACFSYFSYGARVQLLAITIWRTVKKPYASFANDSASVATCIERAKHIMSSNEISLTCDFHSVFCMQRFVFAVFLHPVFHFILSNAETSSFL